MKLDNKKITIIAVLLICVGLISALYLNYYRVLAEQEDKKVEIGIDYDEMISLAQAQGISLAEIVEQLREAGATGVFIRERTLEDLEKSGHILLLTGKEISVYKLYNKDAFTEVEPQNSLTYLVTQDANIYEQIRRHLSNKKMEVTAIKNQNSYILSFPLTNAEKVKMGVGFLTEDMKIISDGGLKLFPRLRTWQGTGTENIELLTETLEKIPNLGLISFNDPSLPALDNLVLLEESMADISAPLGSFEFFPQQGLTSLALLRDKNILRVHAISENDMHRYNRATAVERFTLAVTERNIRVLFVRFFGMEQPGNALNANLNYLTDIKNSLTQEGFQIGDAGKLPEVPYSRAIMFVIGLGVIGGAVLISSRFFTEHWTLILSIGAVLCWGAGLYVQPLLARKVFALLAVVVFPVLSITSILGSGKSGSAKKKAIYAVGDFLKMSFVSICGALLMTGLLADKSYMLKLDQFSGVKLAHVLPIVLIVSYYLFSGSAFIKKVKEILDYQIKFKHAALGVLLLVGLVIYVLRTGNEATLLVSEWEMALREMLDKTLGVRPRTKEFLLGHPAMVALLYYGYDMSKIPLLVLAVIGQVSLVNTYAHIHTPLLISLVRSGHGLWIGIILGILLIAVFNTILGLVRRVSSE